MTEYTAFFIVRIASLLGISALQFWIWMRFRDRIGAQGSLIRSAVATLFLVMTAPSIHIALFATMPFPDALVSAMGWGFLFWNGVLLLALFVVDRHEAPAVGIESAVDVDPDRREFLRAGAKGLTILTFSSPIGDLSGDDDFEVVNKTVRLRNLPEKLKGFRIGMLSDIHSGPYMSKDDMDPYVARINALMPDVILLPGDFVQNRDEEIEAVCETFRHLKAPYGVYGSTGNHEYFADADHISHELELAGVTMLRNEHRIIDPRGEKLALVGLDDVRSGHPFHTLFQQASKGLHPSIPNVLLCHKPYYLEEAAELGLDLMVSGHTHGGQIVLARIFNTVITPAALISGYIEGLYRLDATQMYITRGIGTVGLPIRVNCPPEITVLTLA